jgi:hypothetical protein
MPSHEWKVGKIGLRKAFHAQMTILESPSRKFPHQLFRLAKFDPYHSLLVVGILFMAESLPSYPALSLMMRLKSYLALRHSQFLLGGWQESFCLTISPTSY